MHCDAPLTHENQSTPLFNRHNVFQWDPICRCRWRWRLTRGVGIPLDSSFFNSSIVSSNVSESHCKSFFWIPWCLVPANRASTIAVALHAFAILHLSTWSVIRWQNSLAVRFLSVSSETRSNVQTEQISLRHYPTNHILNCQMPFSGKRHLLILNGFADTKTLTWITFTNNHNTTKKVGLKKRVLLTVNQITRVSFWNFQRRVLLFFICKFRFSCACNLLAWPSEC